MNAKKRLGNLKEWGCARKNSKLTENSCTCNSGSVLEFMAHDGSFQTEKELRPLGSSIKDINTHSLCRKWIEHGEYYFFENRTVAAGTTVPSQSKLCVYVCVCASA